MFIFLFLHQTTTVLIHIGNTAEMFIFLFLHQTTTITNTINNNGKMFIFLFLHQTTTPCRQCHLRKQMFIFLFLHQTTTPRGLPPWCERCLSSFSYIKPQLTSCASVPPCDLYLPFPTSNHNHHADRVVHGEDVYLPFPTSNHNVAQPFLCLFPMFIFLFLHQTTTGQRRATITK